MQTPIITVAQSDTMATVIDVIQIVLTVGLALGGFWMKGQIDKIASLKGEVSTLKSEVTHKTEQVVSTRFAELARRIDAHEERLQAGEGEFRSLNKGDNELKIEILTAIGELRKDISKNCASKESVEKLSEKVDKLQADVLAIKGRAA